jgi:hypothetical protein
MNTIEKLRAILANIKAVRVNHEPRIQWADQPRNGNMSWEDWKRHCFENCIEGEHYGSSLTSGKKGLVFFFGSWSGHPMPEEWLDGWENHGYNMNS